MNHKEETMIRAAAMQYDRDDGMSVKEIAKKYGVSAATVSTYTTRHAEPSTRQGKNVGNYSKKFAVLWNEARYALLLGLRSTWPDEWNAARARILAVKK